MRALSALLLAASICMAFGYEQAMPGLEVPYTPGQGKLELAVQHRFIGEAFNDPFDSFLGADLGANVQLGLRYFMPYGLEAGLSHQKASGEYALGAAWNTQLTDMPVGFRLGLGGFSYEKPIADDPGNRETGFLGTAAAQVGLFDGLAAVTVDAGYDSDAGRLCTGFGLEGAVTERLSLQAEYYPATDGDDEHPALDNDCWTAGLRVSTWGHQFGIVLTNSAGIGLRALSGGVYEVDDVVRLGFSVRRALTI